ncbi:MAG TPA: DoxX family protein [Candidatus Rubrimentiphilum sp.]|nr:DoxX family protein [Candidatus Rubrimentiphilum sp.]
MSIALLIARLIVGLGLAAHGAQKLFGSFGGPGLKGMEGFMASVNMRPPMLMGLAAGLGEFGGGLLIALGLLGGVGPGLLVIVMLTAIFTVHWGKGFFVGGGGWELPGMYIAGALAIDFAGFGVYSIDKAMGWSMLGSDTDRWVILGIAVVIALVNSTLRLLPRPASESAAK